MYMRITKEFGMIIYLSIYLPPTYRSEAIARSQI